MIGALRHRVTFQSRSRTPDGAGGNAVSWTSLPAVWARVKPIGGKEAIIAGRVSSSVTHVVRIRSGVLSVDNSMRMTYNGNTYNVRHSYEVDEGNRWVDVFVEQGIPA